jgi:hypothetical protein
MKSGDVVINIPGRLQVAFKGHVAGYVDTYTFKETVDGGSYDTKFTGTTEELLKFVTKHIQKHNDHAKIFGGTVY